MLSRVLHVAFCVYRVTSFGGLERNCIELACAALRRGHRVSLFTRHFEGERPEGIELHELAVRGWTNIGLDRAFANEAGAALERARPDVVVGFNRMEGLDVFYAADSCLAATRGRPSALALPNRRQRAAWERALFAPGGYTELFVLSARERERYREHHGTEEERLHVLPPGLRAEFLAEGPESGPELRAELGLPREALVVLAVGSDFARKGLDRTLAALATLPRELLGRTWLLAVGAGRPARFRRQARALGLDERVRFAGGRADVLACYRAADLLVHPAREENTGTVLLEALSQGVPVVCSDACGFAPVVAATRAGRVLGAPFDADELAGLCAELLGDDERRGELGERGRAAARAFPMERRTELALDVIERVGQRKRAAGAMPAQAAR
jgi:UDP-glucose:(heptosyl)LPS alpha-1,3-glucosyltransferase